MQENTPQKPVFYRNIGKNQSIYNERKEAYHHGQQICPAEIEVIKMPQAKSKCAAPDENTSAIGLIKTVHHFDDYSF
ncbi:hypothetical protein CHA01nite_10390 [Chryseobacterium hagamense]|uniref:Uncharacterized protein n=1 Tax=Chryseobacterium hagamense TaxID=395935 RepID=A0A511YJB6_9FLAO|nr:hypothetical protein CHA01nite_10390 [Chryseobacterium hagamense]